MIDHQLPHRRYAAEVRAAYRELTHASTTLASLDVIAARPGLLPGIDATLHTLESSSELAYVVAEKAGAPNLTGPARALSIRAHNDIEAGLATSDQAERTELYYRFQEILAEEQPYLFAYAPLVRDGMHAGMAFTDGEFNLESPTWLWNRHKIVIPEG